MRYGGNYKSYGPQYPRGIQEGNGVPADGDLWVSYSVNKGRYVDFPYSCPGGNKCFSTCG